MKAALAFVLAAMISCKSAPPPEFDEDEWLSRVKSEDLSSLYAAHTNSDGTFFSPWMERPENRGNWRSRDRRAFDEFPEEKYSPRENDYLYLLDKNFDSISFAGHASTIIKMNGETIFTDPFFSDRALVLKKKVALKFDFSKIPSRPVVLISHNHYDHLDKETVKEMIKKDAVFLVPLKLKDFFIKLGAREVYELDWWQSVQIGGLQYTFLPAQHWSMRIGQKSGSTLWGGWLIQGSKTVFFSGDSGYFRGFEEFGNRFNIDYALVGAGAYEPRWFMHYSHMNVQEFLRAAEELKAAVSIPIHFGIISLSDEPLVYPLYEIDQFLLRNNEYAGKIK
ncbi:MAG: MBL fold metallo-hydrolase, partial [Treponema sp.]|nr:MBL fold metallo-hydrolase [Treponema sp.]